MGSVSTRRPIARLPHAVCWAVVLVACGTTLVAQSSESRIVIGADVVCRAEPRRDAPVVRGHQLGAQLRNVSRVTVDGEEWYGKNLTSRSSCWTYGPLTADADVGDPAAGLLAVAEHALALEDAADFEHLVAVDNLLTEPWTSGLSRLDVVPPMLALRHLQVVERAVSRVRMMRFRSRVADPLQLAWVIGKLDVLEGPEIIGRFQVPAAAYWELYERYADAPEAETIAWAAVQAPIRIDECETECYLRLVARSAMRYWVAFPEGSHIVEALERGAERLVEASRYCVDSLSMRELSPNNPRIEERIGQLRQSLDAVTVSAKDALLTYLDDLDYWCVTDDVEDLDDPQAIPRLVRVFDTIGRSYIESRFRREFGEAAVQALGDEDSRTVAVALATLRSMRSLARSDAAALSNDAATAVRRTAERWLTDSPQTGFTLAAAILLAGVIEDPQLLEIVETLATDSTAVAARGITDAQSVANLQRLAAEQLADVSAVPRP